MVAGPSFLRENRTKLIKTFPDQLGQHLAAFF